MNEKLRRSETRFWEQQRETLLEVGFSPEYVDEELEWHEEVSNDEEYLRKAGFGEKASPRAEFLKWFVDRCNYLLFKSMEGVC